MQINLHKDLGLNWINLTEFQEVSYLNLFLSQYIIAKILGSNNSFNACPGEPGFILLIQTKRLLTPLKNNVFEILWKIEHLHKCVQFTFTLIFLIFSL